MANMQQLVDFFAEHLQAYPDVQAVNLGGGLPHAYRPDVPEVNLDMYGHLLRETQTRFSTQVGRPIRVEVEPGRYFVAPAAFVVTRVTDVKYTQTNTKGPGHTFVMVDAGFCDLVRPEMLARSANRWLWRGRCANLGICLPVTGRNSSNHARCHRCGPAILC
jgi:diaminopimelate decarboxylase